MTIYLAVKSQSQENIAQRIRDKYLKIGKENTTEVRYFNLPEDLKLAQSIVSELQNDYKIIHSRISFVKDKRPIGTIEIHFDNSF